MIQVSIDRFGRVLIPKKLRDKFGLSAGQTLSLSEEGGRLVLASHDTPQLTLKHGLPVFAAGEGIDISAALELTREKRAETILGDV